jgi:uncharacterized protein YdaU (DUF1376 family)
MSLPWMPLYIDDYLSATVHLTAAESGAYLHLIMHYWRDGSLPNNEGRLARIAKLSPKEWKASRDVLKAFFSDDWRHPRIDKELSEAAGKYEKRVQRAKEAAERRWGKSCSEHAPSIPKRTAPSIPSGMHNSQPTTHTPTGLACREEIYSSYQDRGISTIQNRESRAERGLGRYDRPEDHSLGLDVDDFPVLN